MKVYIVLEDEDYNNEAVKEVFLHEESAKKFVEDKNSDSWRYEEHEVKE